MRSKIKMDILNFFVLAAISGCAGSPPNVQSITTEANSAVEIEKTEELLRQARDKQINIFSPENYTDAEKSLNRAKKKQSAGKSSMQILEQVSFSRAWLTEAQKKSDLLQSIVNDIADARAGANRAGAPRFFESGWIKANKELEEIALASEKGNLKPAQQKGTIVTDEFRKLESNSIKKLLLGSTDDNISSAKKQGAEKGAPRTYSLALQKRQTTADEIKSNPRDTLKLQKLSEDAKRESLHLLDVLAKVKAGNTEELVLASERQQRTISNLQSEHMQAERELERSKHQLTEAERRRLDLAKKEDELEKTQSLLNKTSKLREQFRPNEAEIYTENGKVMLRLKALQFASGSAKLNPKNQALLEKVQEALSKVGANQIIIEGHTDILGDSQYNKELSQKRAQAVGDYIISKGRIFGNKIRTIGLGAEEPISDNETAHGRSENRRIDMIIEAE